MTERTAILPSSEAVGEELSQMSLDPGGYWGMHPKTLAWSKELVGKKRNTHAREREEHSCSRLI